MREKTRCNIRGSKVGLVSESLICTNTFLDSKFLMDNKKIVITWQCQFFMAKISHTTKNFTVGKPFIGLFRVHRYIFQFCLSVLSLLLFIGVLILRNQDSVSLNFWENLNPKSFIQSVSFVLLLCVLTLLFAHRHRLL